MTCIHKVRWSVKRPEDCRFRLSVSHYKDRIVAPDEYSGATVVTPSDSEQVLITKGKLIRDDITVYPAPTEPLSTTENGQFTPSDGMVGFSEVTVDVEPNLTSLSVTENGLYLPDVGVDGFDRVNVNVPQPSGSTTITQNGTYNVEQYASAVVSVPSELDINNIADGSEPSGAIVIDIAVRVIDYAFYGCLGLTAVTGANVEVLSDCAFYKASNLQVVHFPKCKTIGQQVFRDTKVGGDFASQFPIVESIGDRAFQNTLYIDLHLPETLKTLTIRAFNNVFNLKKVYFHGTPTSIGNAFDEWPSPYITDIYVPWSQGEVANAPWGATSATIHYDTVYDSEWNVISST